MFFATTPFVASNRMKFLPDQPMEFQGVQVWVKMGNTADQRPSTNETDFENHEMKRDSKFGSAIHPYLGVNIHSPGTTVL
jgi:hypothetical protein